MHHLCPIAIESFSDENEGSGPVAARTTGWPICGGSGDSNTVYFEGDLCPECCVVWDQCLEANLVQVGTIGIGAPGTAGKPIAIWNKGVWLGGWVEPQPRHMPTEWVYQPHIWPGERPQRYDPPVPRLDGRRGTR